jgi:hypothetical protein
VEQALCFHMVADAPGDSKHKAHMGEAGGGTRVSKHGAHGRGRKGARESTMVIDPHGLWAAPGMRHRAQQGLQVGEGLAVTVTLKEPRQGSLSPANKCVLSCKSPQHSLFLSVPAPLPPSPNTPHSLPSATHLCSSMSALSLIQGWSLRRAATS